MAYVKLSLLPNERLKSFWDALWLGIRRFLYFMLETLCVSLVDSAKLNLRQNERLESFWEALWLGIWPFFVFYVRNAVAMKIYENL